MAESLEWHRVLHRVDAYLDANNRSQDACDLAHIVLDRFEYMVNLAVSRALEDMPLPDDCAGPAVILPFPHERVTP